MEKINSKGNNKSDDFHQFDDEMLWGHYKPHLLYAISQREVNLNNPITISLMYYDPANLNCVSDLKYKVNQVTNNNVTLNFEENDGKTFSMHRIIDREIQMNLSSTFIKLNNIEFYTMIENSDFETCSSNESIGLVINLALQVFNKTVNDQRTLSVSLDDKGWIISFNANETNNFLDEYAKLYLFINDTLISPNETKDLDYCFNSLNNPKELNWQIEETIYKDILSFKSKLTMSEYFLSLFKGTNKRRFVDPYNFNKKKEATMSYFNFTFRKKDRFKIIIHYTHTNKSNEIVTPVRIDALKNIRSMNFNTEFSEKFMKNGRGLSPCIKLCAKQSFCNLMGSLSYSYGNLHSIQQDKNCEESYISLLSHVPSRAGFPRPFLWDEGFHTLITVRWSEEISLKIISDWLGTINENGWIPREQPRGDELRNLIPGLKLDNREANPPTLIFTLLYLKDKNQSKLRAFLSNNNNWEKIKKWFNWWYIYQGVFNNKGDHLDLFRWWGPDPSMNLGSGMDDFPRNTEGYESWANIDATSWGYFFTESVIELAKVQGEDREFVDCLKIKKDQILLNLKTHLYDKQDHLYKDKLINLSDKSLMFSFHLGYPNLMPSIFGIIDDNSAELEATLNFLNNPSTIWTVYGLASLSKEDYYYGQTSNYWRGPIWININFLVLRSLKRYYSKNNKARSIYEKLRENVIYLVCSNWENSGYFFEHYNQEHNGKGNGWKYFNGWTSLITLIIGEDYC